MRKFLLLLILLIFSAGMLLAQKAPPRPKPALPPPLPVRDVTGQVKDATGQTVIGATVLLTSKSDTLRAATDADGRFTFKNVKQATFVITVTGIGYLPVTQRLLNNDLAKKITLNAIVLKNNEKELDEVKINGTPSIVYKTDTIEYRAGDYKVRENSTIDEMLRKMEGFEVGSDGTVTHQGQPITKVRLNGKDYAGGDVAQAIQNLPADVVEKIQVLDDYGDQAGRTGIKDGDPQKILNVTTYSNKSVGNIARFTVSEGNNDRYDDRIFLQRLNGNEQLSIIGGDRNTINGVASTGVNGSGGGSAGGGSGGSGGTTTIINPSFSYRDQLSKAVQINASYRYTSTDVYSINSSDGQTYYNPTPVAGAPVVTNGTTNFTKNSTAANNSKAHSASFEFEYTPDSANFLRITPTFSYSGSNNSTTATNNQMGFINQNSSGTSTSNNSTPTYGLLVLYNYLFKKPKRVFSVQYTFGNGYQAGNSAQNTDIKYNDSLQNLVKDSLVHRTVYRTNYTKSDRVSLQYVEPLSKGKQLEFTAQLIYRGNNNTAITSNISPAGTASVVDSLSNIYKYSFTQENYSANYRINRTKYSLSIGLRAITTHLAGDNISRGETTNRNDLYFIPILRYQYIWSKTERMSVNYSGVPTEPSFTQIQPLPDYTNPQNPVFGNPKLRPSFNHTVTILYNDYVPDQKLNISTNIRANYNQDQIVNNTIQLYQPVTQSYLSETYFTNLSGARTVNANYNVAKQYDNRKYNLELNGSINYGYSLALSNNVKNHLTDWDFNERFGPRINPNDAVEVNPFVSYDENRSFNSLPNTINSNIKTTALNLEGKFYFFADKRWAFEYNISKNYINGISANISKNPFVVNSYISTEFFKHKNGILKIAAFDIFDQNNFINRSVSTTGYTDTKTNALSRYILVSFVLNLQKFNGKPKRKGKILDRRGDGSFIYN